ncbi:hypothetical protein GOB57_21095 [Sinorhizobium meliloti]|nr:hypothetical protein [Sinorhizobium meliloti]
MDWFRNDAQAAVIGGLTIENGMGTVVVHGSLSLSPDTASLDQLRALRRRLAELESALASAIEEGASGGADAVPDLQTVANPFAD